ncbi:MAG: M23 family metallopeptidase [Candidatus Aenigmatarchaeota archaeon]
MVSESDRNFIESSLREEADRLAYAYGNLYRDGARRAWGKFRLFTNRMADFSSGAMTWADTWHLFFDNIRTLIFGPWLIGGLLVFLQWIMIGAYVAVYASMPAFFVGPIVLGLLVFILNMEASKNPMDWLTHIVSGMLIGFSTLILMVSIMGPETLLEYPMVLFWVIWTAVAIFIGVFQFYHTGGFMFIFQLSVLILLFGYVALGPYSVYYRNTIDQIKPPLVLAWKAVSTNIEDVWYLATDPTEYYARQQLKNVRPEKPLDIPKGLEITDLYAQPETVSISTAERKQYFSIFALMENKGEEMAKDVEVTQECKCIPRCNCKQDDSKAKPTKSKDKLMPGEGDMVSFSYIEPTLPTSEAGREAEPRSATVTITTSYKYSTNSSLRVEIASEAERERRYREQGNIYKPVQAIGKVTPAQLSINVGPQPLYDSQENTMIILSVLNMRDDGDVKLPRGTKIKINLPKSIGNGLKCSEDVKQETDGETTTLTLEQEVSIIAYEYKTIYSIYCEFTTSKADTSKTDLITAELIDYTFLPKKKRIVQLMPPLGILKTDKETKKEAEKTGQILGGVFNPVEGGKCLMNFNEKHRAVDITAPCGTPVKAACSGTIEGIGPGLTGDSVFGGTASGGSMGLRIYKLENCKDDKNDWSEYEFDYGCIDFEGREQGAFKTRHIEKGEVIGTVGKCKAEADIGEDDCHVHLVLRKGKLGGEDSASACG